MCPLTVIPRPMNFPQFLVIYDELILNYILALLAVAVLSVFVLGEFKIIALVCLTVVGKLDGCLPLLLTTYISLE